MITRSLGSSISRAHLQCGMILIVLTCFALSPIIRADECAKCPPPGPSRRGGPPPSRGCAALGIGALQNFGIRTTYDTAIGVGAMQNTVNGLDNTAIGAGALQNSCRSNTAIGVDALHNNTAQANTATGWRSLYRNTTGTFNVANGFQALTNNTTGSENTAIGGEALVQNTTGNNNVAVGFDTLANNNGSNNTALGTGAGRNLTTGENNIDIDNPGVAGESGTIRIGNENHTACIIAGVNRVGVTGAAVFVSADGQLGTAPSSQRFKDEIKTMDKTSEAILALRPVSFRYKKEIDPEGRQQFGLVAEEVEKVNPALVIRDAKGKLYTVRYDAVNAMLLNEFLKEHSTVQALKKDVAARAATVKEQSRQIQKLSARIELSKPALLPVDDSCVNCRAVGNTSLGSHALENPEPTASNNTAVGVGALQSNSTGRDNTATGYYALNENEGGDHNTATGAEALRSNRSDKNTATGWQALRSNRTGYTNVADGAKALLNNVTGHNNTAVGYAALIKNTTGSNNVGVGLKVISNGRLNVGDNNTVLGVGSSSHGLGTNGSYNIQVDSPVDISDSRVIRIGFSQTHTRFFVTGISGLPVTGAPVFIGALNQLGTVTSSQRFKEEIEPINQSSEAIFAFRPISFRYRKEIDPEGRQQFGLVAEEVEKVNPTLVVRDKEGKPYSVRYDQVNTMLLNEFLKEHRTVQALKKEVAAVSAMGEEQANQIRKLAAQFDASPSTHRVALQADEECAKCRDQDNTSLGTEALQEIHSPRTAKNTAIGVWALQTPFVRLAELGVENTGTGFRAIRFSNNFASYNTATGVDALYDCRGDNNAATGYHALRAAIRDEPTGTQGNQNVADGAEALANQDAHHNDNTASGYRALFNNRSGVGNVAVGSNALANNNGSNNTALGTGAGRNLTNGSNNVDIGNPGVADESGTIRIGNEQHTRTFVAGISGRRVGGTVLAVFVSADGQLGTAPSSQRFKDEIKTMDKTSEAILALRPVSFRYKKEIDPEGRQQFGLVAEEVEKVNPALVIRDKEGRPYSVRYDQVNAMLLNEFLKEHRTVQALKKEVATLIAIVKEQFRQIQKIGAQLEVSKPAPLVVDNQQSPLASPGAWF